MGLGERKNPFSASDLREVLLNVEGLNDARTKLADFFNSLLLVQLLGDRVGLQAASCRKSAALTVFFNQLLCE